MSYYFIIQSLQKSKKQEYIPSFSIKRQGRGWCVLDGDDDIAFFGPMHLDIWKWAPNRPPDFSNPDGPGVVEDLHTVRNSYINLGAQGWPRHWLAQGSPEEMVKWRWPKKSGQELEAVISMPCPDGEGMEWRLRINYVPKRGAYGFAFTVHAWKKEPDGFEMLNLMLGGAVVSRAESRRWTHSLWSDLDGNVQRIVHSNALFTCTDYADPRWRRRSIPHSHSWVGYAAHPQFNPAFLVENSSVPLHIITCSMLFDEHLVWDQAGQQNLEADGYFHYRIRLELVDVPAATAGKLLKQARDPVRPVRWRYRPVALPLLMGEVNSFEKEIDPWLAEECPFFIIPPDSRTLAWDSGMAHSGRCSIRLTSQGRSQWVRLDTGGDCAVCNVLPGRRYRLSGWIKTRKVERFARLEIAAYEYSNANVINSAVDPGVSGTRDWTRVEVEIDSGDQVYLMPCLALYGPGTAWFDDILLEEVLKTENL